MTICYTDKVATCRGLGNFYKMLIRWKGSIYKVLWAECFVFLLCFFLINMFYRFYLIGSCDKKTLDCLLYFLQLAYFCFVNIYLLLPLTMLFTDLVRYCNRYGQAIPITFVLGFYVSIIVARWWNQFMFLPWPDTLAIVVSTCVDGSDDRGRLIRRTLMRYANVCFVQAICYVSIAGNLRFPTTRHMVEAGLLLEHERLVLEEMNTKSVGLNYWVPIVWAGVVARRARKEGKIKDDISLNHVISTLNNFRTFTQEMLTYDWVNVPLVYTQVVTLAVYMYFLSALIGKQLTTVNGKEVDFYFPIFTFLEFFFYFGWLKVAECLINPYGEDDDDFEVNWLIDRDFEIAYVIVDEMHQDHPNLLKDQYWDEVFPIDLPYTEATIKYKHTEGLMGSTKNMEVKISDGTFVKSEHDLKHGTASLHNKSSSNHGKDIPGNAPGSLASEFAKHRAASFTSDDMGSKHSIISQHASSTSTFIKKPNKKNKPKAMGSGGYWGETTRSTNNINTSDLMEKDDVMYDPDTDSTDDKPDS